ncbi:MAG: SLC13 family permease [Bacillota bacterium]
MAQMIVVAGFLLATLICFITEWLRYDVVALLALFGLATLGLIPAGEVFSGFSNPAVITVASLIVISEAFQRSGAVHPLSVWLSGRAHSIPQLAALGGLTVALLSAFMNNIAAITLLLPVVMGVCRRRRWPPSKVLIPLAFGSLIGGLTSLIGTPPNLLASSMLEQWGHRPLTFFELTPLAIPVLIASVAYFGLVAHRMLPGKPPGDTLPQQFNITSFLVEAVVPYGAAVADRLIRNTNLRRDFDATVLGIIRGGQHLTNPGGNHMLLPGDILQIEVPRDNLVRLQQISGLQLAEPSTLKHVIPGGLAQLTDLVVTARSPLVGRTLREMAVRTRYHLQVLALAHHTQNITERIADVRLRGGDVLLALCEADMVEKAAEELNLVLLEQEPLAAGHKQALRTILLFVAMIAVVAAGILPIDVAAMGTAVLMVTFGCLRLGQAYRAIPWSVIVLLGTMAGVARAVQSSGLTAAAVSGVLELAGESPLLVMTALYTVSCGLASLVTPPAAILLVGPLVLGLATAMGIDPRPFLIMATVGVNSPFLTPFGHQSNVLVFSAGAYRFTDYLKVGLPLCLMILVSSLLIIPRLWPL